MNEAKEVILRIIRNALMDNRYSVLMNDTGILAIQDGDLTPLNSDYRYNIYLMFNVEFYNNKEFVIIIKDLIHESDEHINCTFNEERTLIELR